MLALTGLINWDLLAVGFVAGALWAWSRDRPVLTGILIGLGTATKLYPLFLLGGILIICLRRRRYADLALAVVWAVAAWLVANAPAYLTGKEQWKVFWSFNADRGPDLGSIWSVIAQAGDVAISHETVNLWSWVVFGAWCVGVLVLGLRAPETPRLAQLGFLIVAGFLLVNKVYSPQYVLWLLPLAALARPRWRDQIVWQARRAALLRDGLVVPRRLPHPEQRRGRRLLLDGDRAPDARRALPRRPGGPRHPPTRARPGPEDRSADDAQPLV